MTPEIREMPLATRTAEEAAMAVGCDLDQIAKSIVFKGTHSGDICLFITAGGRRVDPDRAAGLAGGPLDRADAGMVRTRTGFAIGGVAPVGHLEPPRAFFDPTLLGFDMVWAAAGTPHHVFAIEPARLLAISGAISQDFTIACTIM